MKKLGFKFYIISTLVLAVLCTVTVLIVNKGIVFGSFVAQEPYITGEPYVDSSIKLTLEGGNQKGSEGSGIEPVSKEVPTAKGKKGSETNPFVILEVVPDKEVQQLVYLTGNKEDSGMDFTQIGIDAIKGTAWSFADATPPSLTNLNLHTTVGQWFCNYKYDVYKIGSDEEKEGMNLVKIGKIHDVKIAKEDIESAEYKLDEFDKDFKHYKSFDDNHKSERYKACVDLIKKYPKLFAKNTKGEIIEDNVKADGRDWVGKSKETERENQYTVIVNLTSLNINSIDDKNDFLLKHPELFEKSVSGKKIPSEIVEETEKWTNEEVKLTWCEYDVETMKISEEEYKKYQNKKITVNDIIATHPDEFEKDKNQKEIDPLLLKDEGWNLTCKSEKYPTVLKSGYLRYVGVGNGDYAFDQYKYVSSIGDTVPAIEKVDNGAYEYVDELPEGATQEEKDFWNHQNSGSYWSVSDIKKNCDGKDVVLLEDKNIYNFKFAKNVSTCEFNYNKGPKDVVYTFSYYGLMSNNVLKRSLFSFANQEECDNFNVKVITMTPAEINAISKLDIDNNKLDLVERADMFYIASYPKDKTDGFDTVCTAYHRFILGEKDYTFNEADKAGWKSFYENDLEWDSCVKILERLKSNVNLPVVFNQGVGAMLEEGIADVSVYLSESDNRPARGSLNNIAKLFLLSLQFDLQAGTPLDHGVYKRTFFGANGLLSKIKTVSLSEDVIKNADENSAKTTGYYETPEKSSANSYYLWNKWTFYPPEIPLDSEASIYKEYGYLGSYVNTHPFEAAQSQNNSSKFNWLTGSDGSDDKNVTVVRNRGGQNQSTLLGGADNNSVTNGTLDIAYQIMNKQTGAVEPLKVIVKNMKKEYVRISDTDILLDYNSDSKYADKTLYLKTEIYNPNNWAGIIKSIELVDKDEKSKDDKELSAYTAKSGGVLLEKQNVPDHEGNNLVYGYKVEAKSTVTVYIPYSLKDWQAGYNKVKFTLRGRIYNSNKKISTLGQETVHYVSISERELFALE